MVLLQGACDGGGDLRHACVPCHHSVDGNVCQPLFYLKVKFNFIKNEKKQTMVVVLISVAMGVFS